MKKTCLIYGAGGHARVAADALQQNGWHIAAFLDDNPDAALVGEIEVRAYDPVTDRDTPILIGVGNNEARKCLAAKTGYPAEAVIHPAAVVAAGVTVGEGSLVLANAVIQSGARIGRHVIVNANVCIDHDAVIEDFVHVYPNSYIGGGALVKTGVTIPPCSIVHRQTVVETDL